MQSKDSVIDGVALPNAYWVIWYYFGESVFTDVVAEPDKYYLVLEPTVTCQLPISKNDMSYDQIFAATTYGWGFIEMIYSGITSSKPELYHTLGDYGQLPRSIDWAVNKALPLSSYLKA